jgi:hypothetical protein
MENIMALRKQGICEECGQVLYGDEYGAAGHKCKQDLDQDLIKMCESIPDEPEKFSEERYFRLENVVCILIDMLGTGKPFDKHDAGDFLHYIDTGEWK